MDKIAKQIRRARGNLRQKEFAVLIWPDADPILARGRLAKYEGGHAMPPANIFLKILELGKRLKNK